jgi:hypothetical protein
MYGAVQGEKPALDPIDIHYPTGLCRHLVRWHSKEATPSGEKHTPRLRGPRAVAEFLDQGEPAYLHPAICLLTCKGLREERSQRICKAQPLR